ncbi:MAG: ribonuclease P protein component [Bacteroidales bacterium]|nr:ribonuclease P protein component [Bacteroidales bacterium]
MAAGSNTLPREEILRGKTRIEQLMSAGRWAVLPHLKYCWLCTGENGVNRILVSVPKKCFKRAVKRNLLKRRLREAYRTQKGLLAGSGVDILFVYTDREPAPFAVIRDEVAAALGGINAKLPQE